jgi:ADP-ribose pyrophosphatase YjhB (NUDIX family)
MRTVRVHLLRGLYRVAWRVLQLRALLPGRGRGVKCLLTDGARVLLVRHTYGSRATWYLPGGGVHRREPPRDAAAREMREELGVVDLPWSELITWDMQLERVRVRITALHAALPATTSLSPDPVEIAEARWFEPQELPRPLGTEVRPLLALLRERAQR